MGYIYYTSNPAGMQSKAPRQPKAAEFFSGVICKAGLQILAKSSPSCNILLYNGGIREVRSMNPILIVDDEAAIAMLVRRILTEAGYRCQAVTDSRAAANLLEKNNYDLVLLDVMMPHLDGYDLLAYLRPTGTPCIFITAKDAVAERVRGLNSGADDYIVKPFAPTELVARVESVLRRAGRSTAVYTMWEYTVDAAACRVLRGEEEMHLTRKEYDLLLLFLRNRGRALYRDYLYETVWGDDGTGCDTRTLDTHIARLRRKLSLGDRLHSVRQIGYMLEKE